MTTPTRPVRWGLDLDEPVIACESRPGVVVAGGSEGTIVVTGDDGAERLRLGLDDFLLGMAISPDGTRLAAGGGERFAMWDLADGTTVTRESARWCSALAWTDRSDRVAVGDGRRVRIVGRDGRQLWASEPLTSTVAGLSWMRRDGRRVAAAAYRGVTISEPASGTVIENLEAPGAIAGLAVAPNGRWVVGGSQDATLHGWKVPGGNDFTMSGFPMCVSRLAFDSDGRWMACDGGDTVAFWDFSGRGPTGREALLGQGHKTPISALAWAPTGRTLGTGDTAGMVALWSLGPSTRAGERIAPTWSVPTGDEVSALAHVPDGVVTGHRSGEVSCHDLVPTRD